MYCTNPTRITQEPLDADTERAVALSLVDTGDKNPVTQEELDIINAMESSVQVLICLLQCNGHQEFLAALSSSTSLVVGRLVGWLVRPSVRPPL